MESTQTAICPRFLTLPTSPRLELDRTRSAVSHQCHHNPLHPAEPTPLPIVRLRFWIDRDSFPPQMRAGCTNAATLARAFPKPAEEAPAPGTAARAGQDAVRGLAAVAELDPAQATLHLGNFFSCWTHDGFFLAPAFWTAPDVAPLWAWIRSFGHIAVPADELLVWRDHLETARPFADRSTTPASMPALPAPLEDLALRSDAHWLPPPAAPAEELPQLPAGDDGPADEADRGAVPVVVRRGRGRPRGSRNRFPRKPKGSGKQVVGSLDWRAPRPGRRWTGKI